MRSSAAPNALTLPSPAAAGAGFRALRALPIALDWLSIALPLGACVRFGGVLALVLSGGLFGRAFAAPGFSGKAFVLFWAGMASALLAALAWGLGPRRRAWHQGLGLAMFGAATYLPTFLRNPGYLLFQDELYHQQSLVLMRDLATTHIPITFFPIAGDYPGLEFTALAGIQAGLPLDAVVRLVPFLIHTLIPVVAYLALRGAGLRPVTTFIGSLLYASNTSYYFFHATFSYESLGILFFLLVATFSLRILGSKAANVPQRLLLLGALGGAIVTHHISGLLSVVWLAVVVLTALILNRRRFPLLTNTAVFGVVLWTAWLIYRAGSSVVYLSSSLEARVQAILSFVMAEQHQARQLFWNSPLPLPEQLIAKLYPLILGVLVLAGLGSVLLRWRRHELQRRQGLRLLVLGLCGPLVWLGTAPLVLTSSSDVVYRAWPFLFMGVSAYSVLGLEAMIKHGCPWRKLRLPLACAVAAMTLAGGVIVGDNQGGRFRSPALHSAAGPEDLTPDLVSASRWLDGAAGRFNKAWGDIETSTALAAFGMQDASVWGAWNAFYTDDPGSAEYYLQSYKVKYLAVDTRDTQLPPRYRFFFNSVELYDIPDDYDPSAPIPPELLTKFDKVTSLQRIYDNGNILIYFQTDPPNADNGAEQ